MKKTILLFGLFILGYSFAFGQWSGVSGGIDSPLGQTNPSSGSNVHAMQVYNGNLYAGGAFDSAGGKPANCIAMWNGSNWTSLSGVNSAVLCMAVYNGNLYVGGTFDSAGGKPARYIAMWNGTTWSAVGGGTNPHCVQSMAVYSGNLYIGGSFDSVGGKPAQHIAMWNGTTWSAVGGGLTSKLGTYIYSLAVYNGSLYAGGTFDSAGGKPANCIAMWNGATWSSLGSGIKYTDSYGPYVLSMGTYNGALYVGGYFDTAGGKPASNLAEWNCNMEWQQLVIYWRGC